jgi:hypothetical protein
MPPITTTIRVTRRGRDIANQEAQRRSIGVAALVEKALVAYAKTPIDEADPDLWEMFARFEARLANLERDHEDRLQDLERLGVNLKREFEQARSASY